MCLLISNFKCCMETSYTPSSPFNPTVIPIEKPNTDPLIRSNYQLLLSSPSAYYLPWETFMTVSSAIDWHFLDSNNIIKTNNSVLKVIIIPLFNIFALLNISLIILITTPQSYFTQSTKTVIYCLSKDSLFRIIKLVSTQIQQLFLKLV